MEGQVGQKGVGVDLGEREREEESKRLGGTEQPALATRIESQPSVPSVPSVPSAPAGPTFRQKEPSGICHVAAMRPNVDSETSRNDVSSAEKASDALDD